VQITRRSQEKFADLCAAHGTIRKIEEIYEAHGFDLPANFEPAEAGMRRSVCAAAERGADLSDGQVQQRLLRVYLDGIDDFGRRQFDPFSPPAQQADDPLVDETRALVRSLQRDGASIDDEARLTFSGGPPVLPIERFHLLDEPQALLEQLDRITAGIANDPPAAIGAAKDVTESTFKFVLRDYGIAYDERNASLTDLYKLVANALGLTRDAVPDSAKGSQAAHKILQNLSTAVQSLAELRNILGTGHGRTAPNPALARHARLAANASRTVVEFVLETMARAQGGGRLMSHRRRPVSHRGVVVSAQRPRLR
jgi:Abortive infection C-terminus